MKKKVLYAVSIISCTLQLHAQDERWQGITFFSPRSQGANAVRNIVGRHPFIHKSDACDHYLTLGATVEYHRSIRPVRMAHVLFGTDKLTISGSEVANRRPNDIIADYFGLSTKFHSDIAIDPSIQWTTVNFSLYCGLDQCLHGLYFNIHAPAIWTKWGLQFTESIHPESENTDYPADYMATEIAPVGAFSFTRAIAGGIKFGEMQDPLKYGKVCGQRTEGGLADIHLTLGWDFCSNHHGYAGFNFQVVVPTGTRPDSEFLFEPIVGNGRHVQVGAGFSGRSLVWEEGGEQELSVFVDVTFSHFLPARQRRSFDLKKVDTLCSEQGNINHGSRYMLFKQFVAEPARLTPVINHTTLCCDVGIAVQMDAVFMFGYTYEGFIFDIGYNGWIRSKEKICIKEEGFASNIFALKGIQNTNNNASQHLAMLSEPTLIDGTITFVAPPPTNASNSRSNDTKPSRPSC